MKRVILFFLSIAVNVFVLASCDFNAPLRNKMLNYYAEDNNYIELTGTIVSINGNIFEINIITENQRALVNSKTGYGEFVLIDYFDKNYNLCVNDEIIFTSAPMYFYNGHYLPIVSLEKAGRILLSFNEGKQIYLEWIKQTFD